MKNLFISIFLIGINCPRAQAQIQVLDNVNFYSMLLSDFPESFYRMDKNPANDTIFKKEDLLIQSEDSEEKNYLYNVNITYLNSKTIKINCTNQGKINTGLLKPNYRVSSTFNSFFTKMQFVDIDKKEKGEDTILKAESTINLPNTRYLNRKNYNSALRWRCLNNRLVLGISGALASNYRRVLLNNYQSDQLDNLNQRNANEIAGLSTPRGVYFGYAIRSRQLMASLNYQTFGFNIKADSTKIDWKTGLTTADNIKPQSYQQQQVISAGLNYNYSPFRKGISAFFTAGLYASFKAKGNKIDAPQKFNKNVFAVGAKAGVGISYKPIYMLDFRLYPVFYYNFNSIKGSELKTRFYTVGLEAGIFLNVGALKRIKMKK